METVTIDRFEGDIAVCEREDCMMVDIPRSALPKGVRVGNILIIFDDGKIKINAEAEIQRKEKLFKLFGDLFENKD